MQNDDIVRVALKLRDDANQPSASTDYSAGLHHALSCLAWASGSPIVREALQHIAYDIQQKGNAVSRSTADAFVAHYWPNAIS